MPFSRMCETITLTKHPYNANLCFCHVTPRTNTKIIYTMKINAFFKNVRNNHTH